MRIFEKDAVFARSKFWYHMKRQNKVRKIQGEIISTSEIFEKSTGTVRNYGIYFRYLTRTGTVNMYKEFRDTSLTGAVGQMYLEMAGRHSGRAESIQIIRTSVVQNKECRRVQVAQFAQGGTFKFPKTNTGLRPPTKALGARVRAVRPNIYS
jgi:large subunit ribosomal protein L18Ae